VTVSALRRLKHQAMLSRPRARVAMDVSCLCGYGTSGLLRAVCLPWTRASLLGQGDEAVKGETRHARQGKTWMLHTLDPRHPTLDTLTAGGVLGPRDETRDPRWEALACDEGQSYQCGMAGLLVTLSGDGGLLQMNDNLELSPTSANPGTSSAKMKTVANSRS
jgi:hypothetical protein